MSSAPAIRMIPMIPPPTKYIRSIPIANQNSVYPQTRFMFSPKRAYITINICSFRQNTILFLKNSRKEISVPLPLI